MASPDLDKAVMEALFSSREQYNAFALENIQHEEKRKELKHVIFSY